MRYPNAEDERKIRHINLMVNPPLIEPDEAAKAYSRGQKWWCCNMMSPGAWTQDFRGWREFKM